MSESEAAFASWFEDALTLHGYRWIHFRTALAKDGRYMTAIRGMGGYPDYTIVGHGRFMLVELKTDKTYLEPEQKLWRDDLLAAGVEWHCWRPKDRAAVLEALA